VNRALSDNVKAFRALDARIARSEADAEAGRWEQARLAFEAVTSGMLQSQYAEAVGKGKSHISLLCRVWKKWGLHSSSEERDIPFTDALRMAHYGTDDIGTSLARQRGEPPTRDKAAEQMAEQMLADPKVAKAAVAQVMAQSSPTRRAVESTVQASRHERKAAEAVRKAEQAQRSALPFSAFLARMGEKLDDWARELQALQPEVESLRDRGYNLDGLARSAEHLATQAEAWVKTIHPELNNIPDNIIDIG
jgi:hypothetical protein